MNDTAQFFAVVAVIIIALCGPPRRRGRRGGASSPGTGWRRRLRRWRGAVRRSVILKRYGVPVVFALVLALCAARAWRGDYPEPRAHDEFAYLLAADTFERGRLTNPTHPLWEHLESLHILWQPTYTSKYPPGQGLSLALGSRLFGHPVFGVWLIVAVAAAATYWMFRAWFTPGWALVGTLIPMTSALLLWSDNYWGGGLPALGGALLFGALVRLLDRPRPRDGLVLGIGLSILAVTRPFFGLLASLPAAGVLGVWLVRRVRRNTAGPAIRSLLPTLLALGATLAFTGLHNLRTTGDALTMPHRLYAETYGVVGEFVFMPRREPPAYRHAEIADHHINYMLAGWEAARERYGFNAYNADKLRRILKLLAWPGMALPLAIGVLYGLREDPWIRLSVLVTGLAALGALAVIHVSPHYLAPIIAVAMLPAVRGLRQLRLWRWRGRPVGRRLAIGLVLLYVLLIIPWLAARTLGEPEVTARREVVERLRASPGDHLVVVRYGPEHPVGDEWVYNSADPDRSRIVWAREMSAEKNRRLFDYFGGRAIWLVEPDAGPGSLRPYPR